VRQHQKAYLFEFHPRATPPDRLEELKRSNLKRILWGVTAGIAAVGLWLLNTELPGYWGAISKSIGVAIGVVGLVLIIWGSLAGPWDAYQRQATFIALTGQKELVMRSVIGGVLWTHRIPVKKVKGIRRLVQASREQGWYFIDREGRPLARFNPELWPSRHHKVILGAIADYVPNLEITVER